MPYNAVWHQLLRHVDKGGDEFDFVEGVVTQVTLILDIFKSLMKSSCSVAASPADIAPGTKNIFVGKMMCQVLDLQGLEHANILVQDTDYLRQVRQNLRVDDEAVKMESSILYPEVNVKLEQSSGNSTFYKQYLLLYCIRHFTRNRGPKV